VIPPKALDAAVQQFLAKIHDNCAPGDSLVLAEAIQKLLLNQSNAMSLLALCTVLRAMLIEHDEQPAAQTVLRAAIVRMIGP
jgi:hypothetical protein